MLMAKEEFETVNLTYIRHYAKEFEQLIHNQRHLKQKFGLINEFTAKISILEEKIKQLESKVDFNRQSIIQHKMNHQRDPFLEKIKI